ncbi:hypothetical protein JCM11491_003318 [Sporobolomyces phaffii]
MADDPSIASVRFQIDASNDYLIVWTAIMFWDWWITLPLEIRAVWMAKVSCYKVSYLLQRYGSLVFMTIATAILLIDVPKKTCARLFWIETLGLDYVLVTSDALLAVRVYAMFNRCRAALISLTALISLEIAVLVAASCFVKPVFFPHDYAVLVNGVGCVAGDGPFAGIAFLFYVAPFVVNCVLLAATLYQSWRITRRLEGTKLPILTRLKRDGIGYFMCITAVNAINVYFWSQPNDAIKSFNISAVFAVSSTLSCRLALSLHNTKSKPA